jgi:type VI secretion system secreted protein Hcp
VIERRAGVIREYATHRRISGSPIDQRGAFGRIRRLLPGEQLVNRGPKPGDEDTYLKPAPVHENFGEASFERHHTRRIIQMASDMFIKLTGIDGESEDHAHKSQIEILSWSWGVTNAASFAMGTGGGTTKATFSEIHIVKVVDKASVALWQYCTDGKHINEGKVTCRKAAGEDQLEYLVIDLKDVMVTSVQFSGSGGSQQITESVALAFAEFKTTYKQQQNSGAAGGATEFGWNIQKNKKA